MNTDYTEEEIAALAALLDIHDGDIKDALTLDTSWIEKIEEASTVDEISRVYRDTPIDSEAREIAYWKWNCLSLKALESAFTIDIVRHIHLTAPERSEAECATFEKWLGLTSTIGEISDLIDCIPNDDGDMQYITANAKLNRLCKEALEEASTTDHARDIFYQSPAGSESQHMAFHKWLELAETADPVKEAFRAAPQGSTAERAAVLKLLELIRKPQTV